ncbi:MAG: PEGA domain-containing protein [Deltaproteobacteria bacterium]|nr:PEGA domain-containing protein [Deltaproteobacteria bacterium]
MSGVRKPSIDDATLVKPFDDFEKSDQTPVRGYEAYPLLEIQSGPKQGAWFTLTHQKEISIGRANVNSIVLEDNSVSRSHTVIHEVDGKYFVKDVGSRNGTFVNDKKIQEDFQLKSGDRVKVGIYVLKFVTEPEEGPLAEAEDDFSDNATLIEEARQELRAKDAEAASAAQTTSEENPVLENAIVEEVAEIDPASTSHSESSLTSAEIAKLEPQQGGRGFKNFALFMMILLLIGGLGYTAYRLYFKKKALVSKNTKPVVTAPNNSPEITPPAQNPTVQQNPETQSAQANPQTQPAPESQVAPVQAPVAAGVPFFLEVDAQPLPAKIFYQGREIGTTPFKINISAPLNQPQELTAVYHFQELNQDFSEKKTFSVSNQEEVVPVKFIGSLGTLQIKSLPKNTQVYLEGTFASNQLKSQAVKLNDIDYRRPIQLPFGNYTIEIKQPDKLEGSETTVDVVKYRREFAITQEKPVFEVNLTDKDITVFPAKVNSNPPGAEVWVDGKKYGVTPFEGLLPLGKHQLILKREGFNDLEQPLTMTMNTPFVSDISLKTSEAGQFMNKGRDFLKQAQYPQAIEQYAEALKHNPTPQEIGQLQILLGQAYLKTGANDIAIGYFEKAKQNEGYRSQGDVGLAEAHLAMGNKELALGRVIDVMLNGKDEKVKSDAETLFRKISPLKSVILVSTDPAGAKVSINGQEITQPSPLVLSDLGLGTYRVNIQKDGFKPYETRFQMGIASFKSVVVKLEPGM